MRGTTELPEPIRRYFELAPQLDHSAYFAQFAPDAKVEDEGKEYHGGDAIRAWRREVPLVAYTIKNVQRAGDAYDARVEITGDFPGSPVDLSFHFELDESGRIIALTIRP